MKIELSNGSVIDVVSCEDSIRGKQSKTIEWLLQVNEENDSK